MSNVFTYGTLMFQQVWARVVSENYCCAEAILEGYDRKKLNGKVYPGIFPSSRLSLVQGVVYFDVSVTDLARLDVFEGEYYFRKAEQVITREFGIIPVMVYVLKEEYYGIMSRYDWDAEKFKNNFMVDFIKKHLTSIEKKEVH